MVLNLLSDFVTMRLRLDADALVAADAILLLGAVYLAMSDVVLVKYECEGVELRIERSERR